MRKALQGKSVLFALAALALAAPAGAQALRFSSETIIPGQQGYVLNLGVLWTCDDSPGGTTSAPGTVDLIDSSGNIVGEVTATANPGGPLVSLTGPGTLSNIHDAINIFGAGPSPADGHLSATWTITGIGPGPYTARFYLAQRSVRLNPASTVTTQAMDAGGGGPIGPLPTPTPTPSPTPTPTPTPSPTPSPSPSPTPTPTPTQTPTPTPSPTPTPTPPVPPSIVLTVPPSATVFQPFTLGTVAGEPGGFPLASVAVDASINGGVTWTRVFTAAHPSSPTDTESPAVSLASAGVATLRATVTDQGGQTATSTRSITVAKAAQGPVAVSPSSLTLTQGQSATFAASGGITGNYSWGGAASGSGAAQAVPFPASGTFAVTVIDLGDSNYAPSAAATATVTVLAPFNVLTTSAFGTGSVSGGGSYSPGSTATVVATADPGSVFVSWSGAASGSNPSASVLMNANKSVIAFFAPLIAQTIQFFPPGTVSTRTPPLTLTFTSSSGLPVALVLNSGPATLSGNVLTPSGAQGMVTLTATQPGNGQYLAAPPLVATFPIGPPPPGVLLSDDSSATKRLDRFTRTTSLVSAQGR